MSPTAWWQSLPSFRGTRALGICCRESKEGKQCLWRKKRTLEQVWCSHAWWISCLVLKARKAQTTRAAGKYWVEELCESTQHWWGSKIQHTGTQVGTAPGGHQSTPPHHHGHTQPQACVMAPWRWDLRDDRVVQVSEQMWSALSEHQGWHRCTQAGAWGCRACALPAKTAKSSKESPAPPTSRCLSKYVSYSVCGNKNLNLNWSQDVLSVLLEEDFSLFLFTELPNDSVILSWDSHLLSPTAPLFKLHFVNF